MFNEIGLVYTQMAKYEKALESSQCALSILKSTDCDGKLIAVVYQNMGALYNYMGRFQEAVEYHKMAIEKHGENTHYLMIWKIGLVSLKRKKI